MQHIYSDNRPVAQASDDGDFSDLLAPVIHLDNRSLALRLSAKGIPVFPCGANKRPLVKRGFRAASIDLGLVSRWWNKHPNALVGIPTGKHSGFVVADLDRHHVGQDGIAAARSLGVDADDYLLTTVTTPSGGKHLYFRYSDGLTCSASHLPDGVDIRAEGGYVIAPGTALPDGRRYTTLASFYNLPPFPAHLMPQRREPAERQSSPTEDIDFDRVRSALDAIPCNCDRETWAKVGMALHSATGGSEEGFEVWDGWSDGDLLGKYPGEREMRLQWRSFAKVEQVGIGSLFYLAQQYGWQGGHHGVEIDDADFEDLPPLPKPASRLTLLTPAECESAPSRGHVIKGLFAPRDVACIFGAPGAGKSLLAPYLAYAVAQGRDTFGMRTKQGRTFYVAAEDPHGMRGRIRALKLKHGDAPGFTLVDGVSNLLAEQSPDLAELILLVKEHKPALVIIDTLAMAFPGLEENDAKDMGRVVAVARRLTKWGAAVVLIHHDTKAEGATPRGHSLLNGALDVAVWVKRDEQGLIRGRLTKNRNGTCDRDIAFAIATEDGGFDEDGDQMTLPRCSELVGVPTKEKALPRATQAALDVLRLLDQPASEDDWRQACVDGREVSPSEDRQSRVKAFRRAYGELVRRKVVRFEAGLCWEDDGFDPISPADRHGQTRTMSPDVRRGAGESADRQGHTP